MPGALGYALELARRAGAVIASAARKPGTPTPVDPAERERRALAALTANGGPRAYYCLGAGGLHGAILGPYVPRRGEAPSLTASRRARGVVYSDCSGAVSGAMGLHRRIPGYAGGWEYISSDGIIRDANDPAVELVEWVQPGTTVAPWTAIAVYGSRDIDGDGDRDEIGHVALVAEVPAGWTYQASGSIAALTIWECAASPNPGGAIHLRDGGAFARRGRLVTIL